MPFIETQRNQRITRKSLGKPLLFVSGKVSHPSFATWFVSRMRVGGSWVLRLWAALLAAVLWLPISSRHLETVELEARGNDARNQRELAQRSGRLPRARRHHDLGFAIQRTVRQTVGLSRFTVTDAQLEWLPVVKAPDFLGVDTMPMRVFAAFQQVVNRGAGGSLLGSMGTAIGFCIVPPFGMRLQAEVLDDLVDGFHARTCRISRHEASPEPERCLLGVRQIGNIARLD